MLLDLIQCLEVFQQSFEDQALQFLMNIEMLLLIILLIRNKQLYRLAKINFEKSNLQL